MIGAIRMVILQIILESITTSRYQQLNYNLPRWQNFKRGSFTLPDNIFFKCTTSLNYNLVLR